MLFRPLIKTVLLISVLLIIVTAFSGCSDKEKEQEAVTSPLVTTQAGNIPEQSLPDPVVSGSEEVKFDTHITLSDGNTTVNGSGATFVSNTLTITQGGSYSITGTLSDGKIYVNTSAEDKKVKLFFNGVSISCSTDAPVFIENSPKETVIILADGSVNNLKDTAREVPSDENADYATAVIYSKDDLQIEGGGTLNITASFNKGIFSKNDIDIRGGNINITSVDDGIRGKESVEISDGTLNITCGGDGIRTSEDTEEGKGNITISGGNITVLSELDCIQSVADVNISGGTFSLTSGGGSTGVTSSGNDEFMPGGGGPGGYGGPGGGGRPDRGPGGYGGFGGYMPPESSANESTAEDTPSKKGIKAAGTVAISGGSFSVSSADDAIHGANVNINGGELTLESDDDGIHADEMVNIYGGTVNVSFSYEGVEGKLVNIHGGTVKVKTTDDGFNAAGGTDTGRNPMAADYSCEINITDGYVFINADGDGVDSNGNVNQSGGTLIVFGPTGNMNGALDYGGTYTISGGTLLATGSAGMAQSVTGSGIDVLAFKYTCSADVLNTVTDSEGNSIIGFISPKQFGTVVFASDKIKAGGSYDVYSGGSYSEEPNDGVYLGGTYTKGDFIGTLTLS